MFAVKLINIKFIWSKSNIGIKKSIIDNIEGSINYLYKTRPFLIYINNHS